MKNNQNNQNVEKKINNPFLRGNNKLTDNNYESRNLSQKFDTIIKEHSAANIPLINTSIKADNSSLHQSKPFPFNQNNFNSK